MDAREILIALLLLPGLKSSSHLGNIYGCNPDIESPQFYNEGKRIDLCCNISTSFCNGVLSITYKNEMTGTETQPLVKKSNKCSIILTISEPKKTNMGRYLCYLNDERIGSTYVYVLAKPSKPKILEKKISPRRKNTQFILTFDPGDITQFDNITVYEKNDERIWCKNDSISRSNHTYQCRYQYGKPHFRDSLTLVIVKKRLKDSVEVEESFNPYLFIKPIRVIKLRALAITAQTAEVMWCQTPLMEDLLPYMKNVSYKFFLQMHKLQGVWEKRFISIFPPQRETERTSSYSKDTCVVIQMQNLTPFTKYTISVNAATSTGKSRTETTFFTTIGDAPMSPPQEVLFWVSPNHKSPDQKSVALIITWKPIPHDLKGGTIRYHVNLSDDDSFTRKDNVNKSYVVFPNVPYDTDLTIRIWSVNNISSSRSAKVSKLRIPSYRLRDWTQIESHIEIQKDPALAFVKMRFLGRRILGIHWCRGTQHQHLPNIIVCEEFPHVDESVQDSKQEADIFKHTVVMSKRNRNQSYSSKKDYVLVKRYKNSNITIPTHEERLTVNVTEKNGLSTYTYNESDKRPLRFFLSFTDDDNHMSQLFPSNCYYDSSKGEVKLLYKEIVKDEELVLAWEQKCDHVSPTQYLADRFDVSVAETRQCNPVKGDVSTLEHHVFYQTEFRLPQRRIYVCVRSLGRTNESKYEDAYYVKEVSGVKETYWNLLIAGGSIIVLLALVLCLIYYYKRCKRAPQGIGKKLKRFQDFTQLGELHYTQVQQIERYENDSGVTGSVSSQCLSTSNSMVSRPFSNPLRMESTSGQAAQEIDIVTQSSKDQGSTITEEEENFSDEATCSSRRESSSEQESGHLQKLKAQLRQTCPS